MLSLGAAPLPPLVEFDDRNRRVTVTPHEGPQVPPPSLPYFQLVLHPGLVFPLVCDACSRCCGPSRSYELLASAPVTSRSVTATATVRLVLRCAVGSVTLLQPPRDVRPTAMRARGNYAIGISWSDGHESIYPHAALLKGPRDAAEGV